MSVSLVANPQAINPAYNPNYFYIDSTNKNEQGFRYVVSVISGGETLGTYKLRPIPTSLYGEVDIQEILQKSLGEDYDDTLAKFKQYDEQALDYTLQIDEEYLVNEQFTDYAFAGSVNWSNFSDPAFNPNGYSRTALQYSSEPVFEQGDVINVVQDGTSNFRPELEGIHNVLDKFLDGGTWYLVLDLTWIGSGPAEAGNSFYADNKKTLFTGITTSSFRVWRGAFGFQAYRVYDDNDYVTIDSTSKFITSLPDGVKISRDIASYLTVHNVTVAEAFVVFNIDGTLYRYSIGSAVNFILFNVLPSDDNIEDVFSGTWGAFGGGLDLSSVESYTVQIKDGTDTALTRERTVNLYSECDDFDTYDITFMDRLGSWITIPFNKGSYLNQSVDRREYRKKYGSLVEDQWTYNAKDRGMKSYHSDESIEYTVNSGIISEEESFFYREITSSPSVYCHFNGGAAEGINITTAQLPLHKKRTQRDRKAMFKFVKSVQDNINV